MQKGSLNQAGNRESRTEWQQDAQIMTAARDDTNDIDNTRANIDQRQSKSKHASDRQRLPFSVMH